MCDGNACAQGSGMRRACAQGSGMRRRAPAARAPRAISSLASISRGRKAGDGEAAPQMAPARVMAAQECARHTFGCGGGHTLVAFHSAPCGTCRPFVFMLMTQTLWFVCIWMWWFAEVFEVVAD